MTEKELKTMTEADMLALPWDHPGILFLPGRYYYAMGSALISVGPMTENGASIMACLWRFDHEPITWRIQILTRWHAGDAVWNSKDRKQWMSAMDNGPEEIVAPKFMNNITAMAKVFSEVQRNEFHHPEWVIIQGDNLKASRMLTESNVSWVHRKTSKR
jgi:hypothetical protein